MREILFRGKRIDNSEWVIGFLSKTRGLDNKLHICIDYEEQGLMCSSIVIPKTVGQYTGLTDKNGKKIFEWDILKTNKFSEPNKQYIVKFDLQFGAFIGQDKFNIYFVTFDGDSDQFEVIGNIHDNPELIKEAKQE